MKPIHIIAISICLVLVGTMLASRAVARPFNEETILKFSKAVEIPGRILPPGTYDFKLLNSDSNQNIVMIWNQGGRHLVAMVMAIPDFRLETTDKTVIKFKERPGDTAEAIAEWFYPGEDFGQEFVYPQTQTNPSAKAAEQAKPAADQK